MGYLRKRIWIATPASRARNDDKKRCVIARSATTKQSRLKFAFSKVSNIVFSLFLIFCFDTIAFANTTIRTSYASAVKIAAPSVVNVYTDHENPNQDSSLSGYSHLVRRVSLGSGVIIDKNGNLLTNYHVIRNAKKILIALDDGRRVKATLVGDDQETDLAVLHVDLPNLRPAVLGNSDHLEVGDVVLAIGNPFGLGQTVTHGIISAIGRNTIGINQLEDYIQIDAAINPGNSGGALINADGKVIGINTGIYSRSGGFQGVGFAIPINVALNVMQQIIKTGSVKRAWLGVQIRTFNSADSSGVIIVGLLPKSPAAKAGIKIGDLVMYLNTQRAQTSQGFLNYIAQRKPGSVVTLVYRRNNQTHRVEIELGARPPAPIIDDRGSASRRPIASTDS